MGNITVEKSCGHQLNPLINISINKSEITRNNDVWRVKRKQAWDLLQTTFGKIVTTKTAKVIDESGQNADDC